MDIEREEGFLHALRTGVCLFLGAGFSVRARDREGAPLPTGGGLGSELRTRFEVDPGEELEVARVATVIGATKRDELRQFLTSRFTVGSYDPRYEVLTKVRLDAIFTTNIDDLIFCIYQGNDSAFINDLDRNGPLIHDRTALDYVALHGSVRNPDRAYRFSPAELAAAFAADPDRWRYLRHKLNRGPMLFWGYSLEDSGTLEALETSGDLASADQPRWIVLPRDVGESDRAYFRTLGFSLITGDTDEMLDYLSGALETPEAGESDGIAARAPEGTAVALVQHRVPDVSEIVLRPIEDFYAGSAPAWSDIFSRQLVSTSHYAVVDELARKHSAVIMAGIPASGKSTLLMQLAAHMAHEGTRLILTAPHLEQVELILRSLAGRPALVCIDDCTADVDALLKLAAAPNVTVIGAERDYYLSVVLHRIDLARSRIAVHSVTPLTDRDLQDIWDSVPRSMRRAKTMLRPKMTRGVAPSLVELLQDNLRGPRLGERLREALRLLSSDDPEKAELLLLVAYVHTCRTPVSLDMLIGYLNLQNIEYGEVARRLADIGEMLQEAADDYLDHEQDYYTTRSTLAGEAVIEAASPAEVREMLIRFYDNLSAVRIVNYPLFKRRALRANLFARAFPHHEEGVNIYDEQYLRDGSPYILQQKAQYLSHLRRHQEAFEVIEQAKALSRMNWTIESSHAQIMFRANIDRVADGTARDPLDRAMLTLTKCYRSDRRKGVHALLFGDFAIQYSRAYPDERAIEYLEQARAWLDESYAKEKWYNRVPVVRAQVDARLCEMEELVGSERSSPPVATS